MRSCISSDVVVVREEKGTFFFQRLSPASGWSDALLLPWAPEALAGLREHQEHVLLTIAGDKGSLLRADGSGTVFSLTSGAALHSYETGMGGAHRFNSTHLVGTVFPAAEKARHKGKKRFYQERVAHDCAQPIDTHSLPDSEAGKVSFLEWESGNVIPTAARVAWTMRQLVAVQGQVYSHAPCGQYRLYEIPLDGAPIASVMMTGRKHLGEFVVAGSRIANVLHSGYIDGIAVWDVAAKTHSSSSFSTLGDLRPVALLWE